MNGTEFDGMMSKIKTFADETGDPERILRWSSESDTRGNLVEPFLNKVLGYERSSEQLKSEFSIKKKNRTKRDSVKRVDYAINQGNEPKIMIEVKKRGSLIEMDDVFDQEIWYGNQKQSVKFFVLTNGIEWRWHRKSERKFDRKPFLVHDILRPSNDEVEFFNLICKENLNVRKALNFAKNISKEKQMSKKRIDKDGQKYKVKLLTKKGAEFIEYGYAWKPVTEEQWKIKEHLDDLMVSIIKFLAKEYKGRKREFYEQLELNLGNVIKREISNGIKIELGYFLNVKFPNVITRNQKNHVLLRAEKIAMRERADVTKSGLIDYWFSID